MGFNITDGSSFFPFDKTATKHEFIIRLPKPTLIRPKEKVIKGCLSEVEEITEALSGFKKLDNFYTHWDGIIRDEEKTLEEFVDLLLYLCSVLEHFGEQKVNTKIQEVLEKNYKRGYYTQTEYHRDETRGY